jgi:excisionase family DNA binding protein
MNWNNLGSNFLRQGALKYLYIKQLKDTCKLHCGMLK